MKERTLRQISVIAEQEASAFQERVNTELMSHEKVTDIRYQDTNSLFCAIITYEETLKVIETAEDHFKAIGKRYVCNDCPFLELDPDRRSATHYCRKHSDRVRLKANPCDWFWEALKDGSVHLVTPEERKLQYETMDSIETKRIKARQNELRKLRSERLKLEALQQPQKSQKLLVSDEIEKKG